MTPPAHAIERLLVVEDHRSLADTIQLALSQHCRSARAAATVAEAVDLIASWHPDLVVLDVMLPDGSAFDVLDATHCHPQPPQVVAISGSASPAQTFELARRGVHEFLAKPLDLTELRDSVAHLAGMSSLDALLRQRVGMQALFDVEAHVRCVMVEEALEQSAGSVRGAARLLGISRQNLQYILRTQLS